MMKDIVVWKYRRVPSYIFVGGFIFLPIMLWVHFNGTLDIKQDILFLIAVIVGVLAILAIAYLVLFVKNEKFVINEHGISKYTGKNEFVCEDTWISEYKAEYRVVGTGKNSVDYLIIHFYGSNEYQIPWRFRVVRKLKQFINIEDAVDEKKKSDIFAWVIVGLVILAGISYVVFT